MRHSPTRLDSPSRRPSDSNVRGRTTGVRILTRTALSIFLLTGCVALAVLSVPQTRKLRELKEELARARALESHVQDRKDQKRRDLKALRDDPAYLELVARDRLDLYREGEQIYRIDAEKVPQAIELIPSP